jgi:hypothetical protein
MTEQQVIAEGRRYVRAQQAKIEFQRERIRKLERLGNDAQMVRMEKQTLGAMMKSLDQVLGRLRPVIERVGHSE